MRTMALRLFLLVVFVLAGLGGLPAHAAGGQYFPQTQHTLQGGFADYWQAHGGLAQQGYPLTEEFQETSTTNGVAYQVQYFERAVFEYHPENAGTPYSILLSQLGSFRYQQKYPTGAPSQSAHQDSGQYFAQTGHWLGGGFLTYWQAHGAVAQQGYPISDEFQEVSEADGKPYQVQYFERAVFEYHPENAGTPYTVLLTQLGKFRLAGRYPSGVQAAAPVAAPVGQAPPPAATPTPAAGMSADEATYLIKQIDLDTRLTSHIDTASLFIQNTAPSDPTWVSAFITVQTQLHNLISEATLLQVPPRYQGSHALQLSGMTHLANGEELYLRAVTAQPPDQALGAQAVTEITSAESDLKASATLFKMEQVWGATGVPQSAGGPAPSPTPAPPVPVVPTPTAGDPSIGAYTATATISNPSPHQNQVVTVSGTLLHNGQPVAGVAMQTTWHYKTTTSVCSGTTGANGTASCSRDISRATKGYFVAVDVSFVDSSGTVLTTTTTGFSPQ